MRVVAPGKLVLTGAYAVLEGAPAVVLAVDRYVSAPVARPDEVDVSELHDGTTKLGLGSSAASMVASLGARRAAAGADLGAGDVRAELFAAVRRAHAEQQGGGSGVDVAAAVHGGPLVYSVSSAGAAIRPAAVPGRLRVVAFFSGSSARTSHLRARVAEARRQQRTGRVIEALGELAHRAAARFCAGDAAAFVVLVREYGRALAQLGALADVPIVPPAFAALALEATAAGGAFLPSGAGGGDVGAWVGVEPPPPTFLSRARALGMRRLDLGVDSFGVRLLPA